MSVGKNGQQYVVCRLHEGKVEHCPLELPYATLGSNPDLAGFARDQRATIAHAPQRSSACRQVCCSHV